MVDRLDPRLSKDKKKISYILHYYPHDTENFLVRFFRRECDAFRFGVKHSEFCFNISLQYTLKDDTTFIRHTDYFNCGANFDGEPYEVYYDESPITESESKRRCSL